MKRPSLLSQVLAVNVLLITATVFVATLASGLDLTVSGQRWNFVILAMAIVLTLLVNIMLLRRRFEPLERLIDTMEHVDLSRPDGGVEAEAGRALARGADTAEVLRLQTAFTRMLDRLEAERRRSGGLALRAQEEERRRVARDLHDEVNQALTAILLRLEAAGQDAPAPLREELAETQRLANQAMEELLALAHQLRPTALDDLGLVPALAAHVRDFGKRTGLRARFAAEGSLAGLGDEVQLVLYRVVQEALSNAAQHSGATAVEVDLTATEDEIVLSVTDDGRGFEPGRERGALGLSGMRERALMVGGELEIASAPGAGTTVGLRAPLAARAGSPA